MMKNKLETATAEDLTESADVAQVGLIGGATSGPRYVRKITASNFIIPPALEPNETVWIGTIGGEVSSVEEGSTVYGDFVRLNGEFLGASSTGDKYISSACILPGIAEEFIRHHLAKSGVILTGKKRVDVPRMLFAFDIGVIGRRSRGPDDQSKAYSWTFRPRKSEARSAVMSVFEREVYGVIETFPTAD